MSLIKAFKSRWKFGSLVVLLSLIFIGSNFFLQLDSSPKCWNDIDFKKTEHLLLTSSVKRMIPFYKYYKDQEIQKGRLKEEIEKEFFYKYNKVKYDNGPRVFIVIFDNGIKTIFKEHNKKHGSFYIAITFYNFSKFFDLKYVPPIVKRELNGAKGSLQLFIEQDEKSSKSRTLKSNIIKGLSSETKISLYGLIFLMCSVDTTYSNVLISKRCLKPVLIDNDWLPVCLAEYSDVLFLVNRFYYPNFFLSEEDYKKAPLSEKIELKDLSYDSAKNLFPQIKSNYQLSKLIKASKSSIFYLKYKERIFFSFLSDIYVRDLLNISKGSKPLKPVLPPAEFLKKLKKLDRNQIKKLSLGAEDEETWINGILHRRNLILKEAERQRKLP